MNLQRLSRLDLNLLVALQALLEEKSVTRAAQRLFITQPAMSRVLQRLRQQLDDPLFTRTGNELIPTPKARDLELRLPAMLEDILDMVTEGEFDPAAYVGEITIAIPEFIAISLASQLTAVLNQYAPGVILSISSETDSVEGELADGVLDFAIDIQKEISSDIGTRSAKGVTNKSEIDMTLVYILIGFTGLAGAAIAKDDFANLKSPKLKTSEKTLAQ